MATAAHREVRPVHRVWTFVALVLLATLSLLLGTHLHWYWGDVVISLVIASLKAYLVVWFFMDLWEQPFRARLALLLAVVLLALLVGLTATDVATRRVMPRAPHPQPQESFYVR